MKNSEKNSSSNNNNNNNTTNNNVLSTRSIKLQLKAACKDMDAAQTKEYINSLDGYEIKKTGEKSKHDTVFYGTLRIGNIFDIQGIKADGSSRGASSTPAIDSIKFYTFKRYNKAYNTLIDELTNEEKEKITNNWNTIEPMLNTIDEVLESANNRAAQRAKDAAKEAAKIKKIEKLVTSMTPEQMAKQIELLQRAMAAMQAAN